MKKVLLVILAVVLAAAGIGYYLYNKPVASLERKQADVVVTASQLIADYEADETAANAKYHGKVVQVSGPVSTITDEGGVQKVHLDTGNPMSMVICELEDGATPPAAIAGSEVTVKGMCSGYLSDVILVQSTVVK
jgi:hypothetical protein